MANHKTRVVCTNIFQSTSPAARKQQFTGKWAELINRYEREGGADPGDTGPDRQAAAPAGERRL